MFFAGAKQNCKKALTESNTHSRGPFTAAARHSFETASCSVAYKDGQQSPGIKIGAALLSASFVEWLFDIVGF